MKKLILPMLAIAMTGIASVANAAQQGAVPPQQSTFDRLDVNRDGKITRSESFNNLFLHPRFYELDSNRDGALDKSEFSKFEAAQPGSGQPSQAPAQPEQAPASPAAPEQPAQPQQ